jgi:predicted O-linked N-acetylglucosamine transferase (SPINDLY family)
MQPGVVKCWARVMHGVQDSHLLLKSKLFEDNGAKKRYLQMFIDEGIAAERLELYGRLPDKKDHLKFYSKVDIGLDPFPYNGTTTTCEALWMGVPVVTLLGERHSGRVGASIMHHVDLPELVADSIENYVKLAIGLVNDQDRLDTMRGGLRQHMHDSEIMNKQIFTRSLEKAYRQMWIQWCMEQV